ncbi:unnamed protein product [Dibothriocephalus latus]|uniref:Uncharacterized protein n=1 Tax=Dibothriocephalus latus TaxID=60516 RepID=A0A3P6SNN6_DIBLA|nr:unnamed protein product [Dibothriocephalus latus]
MQKNTGALPRWLSKGEVGGINNVILAHMVSSGFRVDTNEAFKVIYKIPRNFQKSLGERLLTTVEATALRLRKLVQCAKKDLPQAPSMAWPTVTKLLQIFPFLS